MGAWVIFDDETVDSIKESDIPKYFGDSNAGSAYVLYYQAMDVDLSALGLRSPSPDPVVQPMPQSEPPQLWQPADSPVSMVRPIPLPPGLNDPPVPEPAPRPITPPTLKHPVEPLLKSPRKAASQLLKSPSRPSTALSRAQTTFRTDRSVLDEKFNSLPKPSLQPVAIRPDLEPLRGSSGPVNGKERDSDKGMMGWFRPWFKTVRSRPSSEINPDSRPPSQNALTVLGSPARHQSTSSSSNSSKDSHHPVDSPTSSHRSRVSPLPNGKPLSRSRAADASTCETESRHSSVSASSNTVPTSPIPDRNSQSRSLPAIPASPHASAAETPLPASARTSLDHTRVPRRPARPSVKEHGPRHLKPAVRPATSTGSPTQSHPSPHSAQLWTSSSPAPDAKVSVNRSDLRENARPKSAHNSYGFLMLPPNTATPSVPVSAPGTTGRRTGRKLSLNTPMLGFKKREKDQ